jgi:hypothetical protein
MATSATPHTRHPGRARNSTTTVDANVTVSNIAAKERRAGRSSEKLTRETEQLELELETLELRPNRRSRRVADPNHPLRGRLGEILV